jgi:hypothetical protein
MGLMAPAGRGLALIRRDGAWVHRPEFAADGQLPVTLHQARWGTFRKRDQIAGFRGHVQLPVEVKALVRPTPRTAAISRKRRPATVGRPSTPATILSLGRPNAPALRRVFSAIPKPFSWRALRMLPRIDESRAFVARNRAAIILQESPHAGYSGKTSLGAILLVATGLVTVGASIVVLSGRWT